MVLLEQSAQPEGHSTHWDPTSPKPVSQAEQEVELLQEMQFCGQRTHSPLIRVEKGRQTVQTGWLLVLGWQSRQLLVLQLMQTWLA